MNLKVFLAAGLCLIAVDAAEECVIDDDCEPLNSCVDEVCTHKDLIDIDGYEWLGTICVILASAAAKSIAIGSKAYSQMGQRPLSSCSWPSTFSRS